MTNCISEPSKTKICSKCKRPFPATFEHFYHDKKSRDGFTWVCKNCHGKRAKEWRESHPEYLKNYLKEYNKTNSENIRLYRQNHKKEISERTKRWNKANADKKRIYNRQRRARKRDAEGTYTVADMRRQFKAQKGKCWHCGKAVAWEERHEDHLIPLNRGGTNKPDNIVISCAHCNLSKRDKLPHEFNGRLL